MHIFYIDGNGIIPKRYSDFPFCRAENPETPELLREKGSNIWQLLGFLVAKK